LVPSKECKKDGKVHGEVEPGVEDPIEPSTGAAIPDCLFTVNCNSTELP
jgi:hypothetical protein